VLQLELPFDVVKCAALVNTLNIPVLLDPSPAFAPLSSFLFNLFIYLFINSFHFFFFAHSKRVPYLKLNEHEARVLSGIKVFFFLHIHTKRLAVLSFSTAHR
jgi:hypothetical protein